MGHEPKAPEQEAPKACDAELGRVKWLAGFLSPGDSPAKRSKSSASSQPDTHPSLNLTLRPLERLPWARDTAMAEMPMSAKVPIQPALGLFGLTVFWGTLRFYGVLGSVRVLSQVLGVKKISIAWQNATLHTYVVVYTHTL